MKYVYILESLDSEHFYVGITDGRVWRSITLAKFLTPRSMGLGEFEPTSRSTTPHVLSHSNGI